jgi:hypothetical protein
MQPETLVSNPFALLMNPEAVHAALARSERLNNLNSRIWRPLDQPLIPRSDSDSSDDASDSADESN